MTKINDNLREELERLVLNSTRKREMLMQSAQIKSKTKKNLSILSGCLSLLSAGAITTVLVRFIGNSGIQIIAAITAGVSGIISLLITGYYKEDETSKIFAGSSKYLALRDKAYRIIIQPKISNEEVYTNLSGLQSDYAELDTLYSPFFVKLGSKKDKMHHNSSQAPPVFVRNKAAHTAITKAVDAEKSNLRELSE